MTDRSERAARLLLLACLAGVMLLAFAPMARSATAIADSSD
jgi:hypothetical protein